MNIVFSFLGGLGVFVYGMTQMADGLQKTAEKKLRQLLSWLTTNRITGLLVGAGSTVIVQSSSATTVMVVGFVNAGLMTITQAVGVIMGANIGTTITAQLIAFRLTDYALHAVAIGVILFLFADTKRTKQIGQALLGFGFLFLGLGIMEETVTPLRDSQIFIDAMEGFAQYPPLGVLIGAVVTVMVQSSTASMGILLSLMSVGAISYHAAVPIILGENIGTTITAVLSSIGANWNARRAAAAHVIFNVLGVSVFMLFYYLIPDLPGLLEGFFTQIAANMGIELTPTRLLANTHTAFNLLNALLWLPFVGVLVKIVHWILPKEDTEVERGLKYVDERMLETPGVAVDQLNKEVVRMVEISFDMLEETREAFIERDKDKFKSIKRKEGIIDGIEEELLTFLTKIPQERLTDRDVEIIDEYFLIVDAVESIADDADEVRQLIEENPKVLDKFSDRAQETLLNMFDTTLDLKEETVKVLGDRDLELAKEILEKEKEIDELQVEYKGDHMKRLNAGSCLPVAGIIYLEMLETLEHISDQTATIAHSLFPRDTKDRII